MPAKKRTTVASTKTLAIRCTPRELDAWKRLAKKRHQDQERAKQPGERPPPITLASIVRDGLTARALSVCLCESGAPICIRCQAIGEDKYDRNATDTPNPIRTPTALP